MNKISRELIKIASYINTTDNKLFKSYDQVYQLLKNFNKNLDVSFLRYNFNTTLYDGYLFEQKNNKIYMFDMGGYVKGIYFSICYEINKTDKYYNTYVSFPDTIQVYNGTKMKSSDFLSFSQRQHHFTKSNLHVRGTRNWYLLNTRVTCLDNITDAVNWALKDYQEANHLRFYNYALDYLYSACKDETIAKHVKGEQHDKKFVIDYETEDERSVQLIVNLIANTYQSVNIKILIKDNNNPKNYIAFIVKDVEDLDKAYKIGESIVNKVSNFLYNKAEYPEEYYYEMLDRIPKEEQKYLSMYEKKINKKIQDFSIEDLDNFQKWYQQEIEPSISELESQKRNQQYMNKKFF